MSDSSVTGILIELNILSPYTVKPFIHSDFLFIVTLNSERDEIECLDNSN